MHTSTLLRLNFRINKYFNLSRVPECGAHTHSHSERKRDISIAQNNNQKKTKGNNKKKTIDGIKSNVNGEKRLQCTITVESKIRVNTQAQKPIISIKKTFHSLFRPSSNGNETNGNDEKIEVNHNRLLKGLKV